MTTLHLDFETRSPVDLKKTGAYVYAEHPDTDIWCAAYALGDEPPKLWTPGMPVDADAALHIASGGTVTAHNANFERVIWHYVFGPRYGWPEPKIEQFRCTMAYALAMSLPGGLDALAGALKLDVRKDEAGYRKMLQMSRPRKRHEDGTFTWWDDDERKEILFNYCKQDVVVERKVEKAILPLRPQEQKLWELDQQINDRGVYVDKDLCTASQMVAEQAKRQLDRRMRKVTESHVTACTNSTQLREWVNQRGILCDSVAKANVDQILSRDDIPEDVRAALLLRQEGGKTSTAKADALLNGTSKDGRSKGLTQYHAASTGRWGGRRFQPQNLKRPDDSTDIAEAIGLIKARNLDAMLLLYDDPISVIGDCLRGMVAAAPGKILRAADFSNIEGRVLAWLAGERWKIEAFAAFDRGEGEDLYKVTAGNILDKEARDVTKGERQSVGKVSELALGYQGGVGAMMTMSGGRVDFGELTEMLSDKMPDHASSAQEAYEQRGRGSGMSKDGWVAAEIIKLAWRATNSKISAFWGDVEAAAMSAVADPGTMWQVGKLKFKMSGSFLFMQLPSGRALAYAYPKLVPAKTPWGSDIYKLKFEGTDSVTKKWGTQETYGGKLVENATQAVARDVLAHSLLKLDQEGWPIILHVHDEIVVETDPGFGSTEALEAAMSAKPAWLGDCPVSAEGWSEERYRK